MTYELLKQSYYKMYLIREFEETLYKLFSEGLLYGTTHAYIGQEAVAVGVINNLDIEKDIITSHHRCHGHFLAYSENVYGLMSEIMGKESGVCGGRGGSQHLYYKNFYSNGILGSTMPVGVGMAFAEKQKGTGAIVCNFLGDGILGQGVLYEALNMASLWRLPVIFCVENNHYQQAVHVDKAVAGDIVERGRAFGIETATFDGNDVENISKEFGKIVERVREESIPYWVVFDTYRLCGHSKSDDLCYRTREEENAWHKKDPIDILSKKIDEKDQILMKDRVKEILQSSVERAKKADFPTLESL